MSIFKKATKLRLRFHSSKGQLSVEDLWKLPMVGAHDNQPSLNSVATQIFNELQSTTVPNFVGAATNREAAKLELKLSILKEIIADRQADTTTAELAQATKARNSRIREIIATKQDDSLSNKSLEELEKLLSD